MPDKMQLVPSLDDRNVMFHVLRKSMAYHRTIIHGVDPTSGVQHFDVVNYNQICVGHSSESYKMTIKIVTNTSMQYLLLMFVHSVPFCGREYLLPTPPNQGSRIWSGMYH